MADHWNHLRGSLDEMFGAFGTQVAKTGEWNATLMEQSFDAIINETTLFDGGVTGGTEQLVLVRGYPGPLGVPFAKIPTDQPGANPRGPNLTITVPTWGGPLPLASDDVAPAVAVSQRGRPPPTGGPSQNAGDFNIGL